MANMLYNEVELPDIETVWTDKETYRNALIIFGTDSVAAELHLGTFASAGYSVYGPDVYFDYSTTERQVYRLYQGDVEWSYFSHYDSGVVSAASSSWVNENVYYSDGVLAIRAYNPVDPNAPVSTGIPYTQEFRNYLAAGIVCQSLWPGVEKAKTLVGYSYNGNIAPVLPVNDYGWAFMYNTIDPEESGIDKFVIIGEVGTDIPYEDMVYDSKYPGLRWPGPCTFYALYNNTNVWAHYLSEPDMESGAFMNMAKPYWSSVDVEGVVVATDPIPVYE